MTQRERFFRTVRHEPHDRPLFYAKFTPDAEARLTAFFRAVVLDGLLASETWLTGEIADGADDDRDGILKAGDVPVGNGVAPSFRREIRFE